MPQGDLELLNQPPVDSDDGGVPFWKRCFTVGTWPKERKLLRLTIPRVVQ